MTYVTKLEVGKKYRSNPWGNNPWSNTYEILMLTERSAFFRNKHNIENACAIDSLISCNLTEIIPEKKSWVDMSLTEKVAKLGLQVGDWATNDADFKGVPYKIVGIDAYGVYFEKPMDRDYTLVNDGWKKVPAPVTLEQKIAKVRIGSSAENLADILDELAARTKVGA